MPRIRYNEQRAKNAITFLLLVLLVEVLKILAYYSKGTFLEAAPDYGRVAIIAFINAGIGIGAFVSMIMWFRRAYNNLHLSGKAHLNYSESSAAWSWFIPIFNFLRPYQIMRELWGQTIHILRKNSQHLRLDIPNNWQGILGLWWFFWVSSALVGVAARRSLRGADIESLTSLNDLQIFYTLLKIGFTLCFVYIIHTFRPLEEKLFESLAHEELEERRRGMREGEKINNSF